MKRNPLLLLNDALRSVDEIGAIVAERQHVVPRLDRMLTMALERQFTTLGEALGAFKKTHPDEVAGMADVTQAIRMRHVLVHAYAEIDVDQVWSTAVHDVPRLRILLVQLIARLPSD